MKLWQAIIATIVVIAVSMGAHLFVKKAEAKKEVKKHFMFECLHYSNQPDCEKRFKEDLGLPYQASKENL